MATRREEAICNQSDGETTRNNAVQHRYLLVYFIFNSPSILENIFETLIWLVIHLNYPHYEVL